MDKNELEQAATELTKKLIDEGKIVEAGFEVFRHAVIPMTAPEIQVSEMRLAWMASAEHLFSSIMSTLDPDDEPTDDDIDRLDNISRELDLWRGKIAERVQPSQGSA